MRTIILLAVLSLVALPAFAQKYISWEAEDFNDSNGTKFEVFTVPTDHPGNAAESVDDYTVTEASVVLTSVHIMVLLTMVTIG